MAKIANFQCFYNEKKLPTDAYGNNAAFACPHCDKPILFLAVGIERKKAEKMKKRLKCTHCSRGKFLANVVLEEKCIYISDIE